MNLSYLQNRYEVDEIELGYQFTTCSGVTYFLTFFSYPSVSEFLETRIYMFNIERSHHPEEGQDDVRVRNSVLYVLDLFFQMHEDALISICDVADGKQQARKRLFDIWFKQFNSGRLKKIDADCMVDETWTSVSLYYSSSHSSQRKLENEFMELVKINFYC